MHAITETEFFLPEKCSDITDSEKCICFLYDTLFNVQLFKPDTVIEEKDAEHIMDISERIGRGKMLPMLVDMKWILEVTRSARKVFQHRAPITGNAVAMVVESKISRLIANIFLSMNQMPIPIKLFNDIEDAHDWLKKFQT